MINDRIEPTYWNYDDANRIGGALNAIQTTCLVPRGVVLPATATNIKRNWKVNDFVSYEQLNDQLITPLNETASIMGIHGVADLGAVPFDYHYANDLEDLIVRLYNAYQYGLLFYTGASITGAFINSGGNN